MRVISVCVAIVAAGCAGTPEGAPAQVAAPVDDGITEFGRQVPRLVERYLDEAGERGEDGWALLVEIDRIALECPMLAHDAPDRPDFREFVRSGEGREEQRARVVAAIADLRVRGLFDKLDEAATVRRAIEPPQADLMHEWEMGPMFGLRHAATASAAEMVLAAERSDGPAMARAFGHCLALGRLSGWRASSFQHRAGFAFSAVAMNTLVHLIMAGRVRPEELRRCADVLERQILAAPLALCVEGDLLLRKDILRGIYRDPERTPEQAMLRLQGVGELHDRYENLSRERAMELMSEIGPLATEAQSLAYERWFEAWLRAVSRMPTPERFAALKNKRRDEPWLGLVVRPVDTPPDVPLLVGARAQFDAMVEGTRALLAVELWRAEQGEYPASLDELTPRLLARMPMDPYTGELLRYRRLAEPDDLGRGYVLYSVGLDGVDDGGKEDPDRIAVATSENGEGYDFVINARVFVR